MPETFGKIINFVCLNRARQNDTVLVYIRASDLEKVGGQDGVVQTYRDVSGQPNPISHELLGEYFLIEVPLGESLEQSYMPLRLALEAKLNTNSAENAPVQN